MKNIKRTVLATVLSTSMLLSLSSCGNSYDETDNNETYYMVLEENGNNVLHVLDGPAGASLRQVAHFETDCCKNEVWASIERCVVYTKKPAESAYDDVCEHLK